jgi:hypothetical protein
MNIALNSSFDFVPDFKTPIAQVIFNDYEYGVLEIKLFENLDDFVKTTVIKHFKDYSVISKLGNFCVIAPDGDIKTVLTEQDWAFVLEHEEKIYNRPMKLVNVQQIATRPMK